MKIINNSFENIEKYNFSIENKKELSDLEINKYLVLFKKIGLKNLFSTILEKSVIDYVVGVLVGLDTNGRKNRSGKKFESMCEELINEICKKHEIKMYKQTQFKDLNIKNTLLEKRADFILLRKNKVLNIEVNYFNSQGSKPEEIIESYINRKNELLKSNIDFLLITDGTCWANKNKTQLIRGLLEINMMNYKMAQNGLLEKKIKSILIK